MSRGRVLQIVKDAGEAGLTRREIRLEFRRRYQDHLWEVDVDIDILADYGQIHHNVFDRVFRICLDCSQSQHAACPKHCSHARPFIGYHCVNCGSDQQELFTELIVLDRIKAFGGPPSEVIEELHYIHHLENHWIREAIWQLLDEGKIILTENRRLEAVK